MVNLVGKKEITDKILIIDGIARSGKFLLGNIISSFNQIEHVQHYPLMEIIPFLVSLKLIKENVAVSLLKTEIDMHIYDMYIGRNFNLRKNDMSSIYKSPFLKQYLGRCARENIDNIVDEIKNSGRYSLFITHHLLCNAGIYFKIYPLFKMIYIRRHPVDLVYSWYKRGWGHRFGKDPLDFTPAIKGLNQPIPWFMHGKENKYENALEMDKIILSIDNIISMTNKGYDNLRNQQKKSIIFVKFEDLVTKPHSRLERISCFLNRSFSVKTKDVLSREMCFREKSYLRSLRKDKRAIIKKEATEEAFSRLMRLSDDYEQ